MATLTWSRAPVAAALSYARDRSRIIRSWIVLRMFSKSTDLLTTVLVDNALPLCVAVTVVSVAAFVKKFNLLYRHLHKVMYVCNNSTAVKQVRVTTMTMSVTVVKRWRSLQQRRADICLVMFYKILHGIVALDRFPQLIPLGPCETLSTPAF